LTSGAGDVGDGYWGKLGHGHGGTARELVPRLVESLVGKTVVGAAAVWTEAGELFTDGICGQLGHGREENELVPRLVDSLVGKKVSGAVAGGMHTAAWTEAGRSSLLGHGGRLGHGEEEDEDVPRLVAALAGKKVVGAAAGADYTAVWTDGGELFTCGGGHWGKLGHGVPQNEPVPRLIKALVDPG